MRCVCRLWRLRLSGARPSLPSSPSSSTSGASPPLHFSYATSSRPWTWTSDPAFPPKSKTALQRRENCTCNAVKDAFVNAVAAAFATQLLVLTQWKLPLHLGGNRRCNSVEPAFATQWKLHLQLGGNCLCNVVESAFAT